MSDLQLLRVFAPAMPDVLVVSCMLCMLDAHDIISSSQWKLASFG
jgi:hypothetical protein